MLNLSAGVSVPPAGSASATAVRRLQKDYAKLMQDPVDGIKALPNEDNILEWHYCLRGSPDTPFQGGYYWGKVIFKENFPWSPPAITMITPNGRFATNTRLCLSISDYHPESWNPGWTVSAILIGLHSFMNENQPAAGSIPGSPQEQKNLAAASKEFNVKYREFRRFFPQLVKDWTGVLPTPNEPDVAPTMLPEHATPTGIAVPTIQAHSSRQAFANRQFDDMMNAVAALRPAPQPHGGPQGIPQPAMMQAPPGMMPIAQVYGMYPPPGMMARVGAPLPRMPGVQPNAQIPGAPNGQPLAYRDLAAMAAQQQAQQQARQQLHQQAHQQAQEMMAAHMRAAGVPQPVQGGAPNPPQQRALRPRGQAQQRDLNENGRRAELLARFGIGGQQGADGEQLGRGVRRAARRADPQNTTNNDVTAPKRARVGNNTNTV